ncbi:PAS domain-containing protein [Pilimelia terevasa]|uniref:PAS domain-containing protein n=1 Tax=Pilimelia terevasa TaxID=53372 RepID=UPI00166F60DA|nr:PAS domain-containing protein [Pilimelia terevasa]
MAFALACAVAVAGSHLAAQVRRRACDESAARASARASGDFVDAVLQTVGCLVAVVDRGGRVTLVNRRWEELLGWTAAETAGPPFWEFGTPTWSAGRDPVASDSG